MIAESLQRDPYVTAFWLLADEMQEKHLVEILRKGSALLQNPSAYTKVGIMQVIGSHFSSVMAEHNRWQLKETMRKCQLWTDLESI